MWCSLQGRRVGRNKLKRDGREMLCDGIEIPAFRKPVSQFECFHMDWGKRRQLVQHVHHCLGSRYAHLFNKRYKDRGSGLMVRGKRLVTTFIS